MVKSVPEVRLCPHAPSTLEVAGALVFATVTGALEAAMTLLRQATPDTLDLGGVTAVDSAGLAWLIAVVAAGQRNGRHLDVVNMPAGCSALARVCEVESLLG